MDSESVTIRVEDLRRAFSVLVDAIAANFGSTVTLCGADFYADHYWDLELEAAFGLVDDPGLHIGAGQASDDVDEVRDVVEREGGEVFRLPALLVQTGDSRLSDRPSAFRRTR